MEQVNDNQLLIDSKLLSYLVDCMRKKASPYGNATPDQIEVWITNYVKDDFKKNYPQLEKLWGPIKTSGSTFRRQFGFQINEKPNPSYGYLSFLCFICCEGKTLLKCCFDEQYKSDGEKYYIKMPEYAIEEFRVLNETEPANEQLTKTEIETEAILAVDIVKKKEGTRNFFLRPLNLKRRILQGLSFVLIAFIIFIFILTKILNSQSIIEYEIISKKPLKFTLTNTSSNLNFSNLKVRVGNSLSNEKVIFPYDVYIDAPRSCQKIYFIPQDNINVANFTIETIPALSKFIVTIPYIGTCNNPKIYFTNAPYLQIKEKGFLLTIVNYKIRIYIVLSTLLFLSIWYAIKKND